MPYRLNTALLLLLFSHCVSALDGISWMQWGEEAFERARKQNRMILLDVGMEGCTACRRMDEITYSDSRVIALVNRHFVPVVADAEAQPDLGERYSDWAWPATIFMDPAGIQVLALAGNRLPENFIPILENLVEKKTSGELTADALAPYAAPPAPSSSTLTEIRDRVRGQLDRALNDERGGWQTRGISTASGARVEHLFFRAHMYSHKELQGLAVLTSNGYLQALDPVWGGVFVQAFHQDTTPPPFRGLSAVPEKRISNQADALVVFSTAFRVTGEPRFLRAIEDVDRYLRKWMMQDDGTFFTSQEDRPVSLPADKSVVDYWLLETDNARRQFGVPPIDHAVYTDKNAQVIRAYVLAWEATGNQSYLTIATQAARTLIADRLQKDGWIGQAVSTRKTGSDDRMRPLVTDVRPYLSAQAWFGTALLALYQGSGDEYWLSMAGGLADTMLATLYDDKNGGFYSSPRDQGNSRIQPRKPLEFNARAAHFFYDLWVLSKVDRYKDIAERTLLAVAVDDIISREGKLTGETAMALEKVTAAYVEFSVVGDTGNPASLALYEAGRMAWHPRKLLHFEKPGRYPVRKNPAMYICNPDRCSIPIEDPDRVKRQADSFRQAASSVTAH